MIFVNIGLVLVVAAFAISLLRVVLGPSLADRAVAVDVCFFSVVAVFALLAARNELAAFADAVLIASLVGFLATVSLARLVSRGRR
ncbi:MAG: pesticidal protein Cry26Aa [Actinobacteria bacterium]|jgi:multicomponent Na+:H+ antiporter subunit F|nr:pesticidal protein Cry26Aa [Actinomycetota bacterium]